MRILIVVYLLLFNSVFAKLGNTLDENRTQYGEPVNIEEFNSKAGFTGYVTYDINSDWKLKAFFINNNVRSEHLIVKESSIAKYDRNQVRLEANKMWLPSQRGSYRKKLTYPKVEGHFFDKGLVAYEYKMDGNKLVGYNGIKVLLYENNQGFFTINPKAYL